MQDTQKRQTGPDGLKIKPPLEALLQALAEYMEAATGTRPSLTAFKPATEGRLGLSAFIRGDAPAAAETLNGALAKNAPSCLWEGIPILTHVKEKNGWLLLTFTPDFWEKLLELGQSLPPATLECYWGNRLHMLSRKGDAPCPTVPPVQETLLLTFWAWGTGRYPQSLPGRLLTLTYISPPAQRLALENQCGSLAKALLGFMGDAVKGAESK